MPLYEFYFLLLYAYNILLYCLFRYLQNNNPLKYCLRFTLLFRTDVGCLCQRTEINLLIVNANAKSVMEEINNKINF